MNYTYPYSTGKIISTPFAIVNDENADTIRQEVGIQINDKAISLLYLGRLKQLLFKLIIRERQAEKNFLDNLTKNTNDEKLKSLVNGKNFSAIFTYIKYKDAGLINAEKNLTENFDRIEKQWQIIQNKAILKAFRKAITNGDSKTTIGQIKQSNISSITIREIMERAEKNYFSAVEEELKGITDESDKAINILLKDYLSDVWKLIGRDVYNKMGSTSNTLKKYMEDNAGTLISKNAKKKVKNEEDGTILQFANQLIGQLDLNGAFGEYFLDVISGSIRVGNIRAGSKQIKTDNIELYNAEYEIDASFSRNIENILDDKKEEINQKLKEERDKIDIDKNFLIHYSVKDYFKGKSKTKIEIEGASSFGAKIAPLQNLSNQVDTGIDIEKLIFSMVNLYDGLIAQGAKEQVKQGIISLLMAYTFDDYIEAFQQVEKGVSNNKLNCYFINGKYYLNSEILTLALNQLTNINDRKFINMTISNIGTNPYNKKNLEGKSESARWEQVRAAALKTGKIGIKYDLQKLETIFNSF